MHWVMDTSCLEFALSLADRPQEKTGDAFLAQGPSPVEKHLEDLLQRWWLWLICLLVAWGHA